MQYLGHDGEIAADYGMKCQSDSIYFKLIALSSPAVIEFFILGFNELENSILRVLFSLLLWMWVLIYHDGRSAFHLDYA
jgi:hypothetical protein